MLFIKDTKYGLVVGFYEAPKVDGTLAYVATVFPPNRHPWSVSVGDGGSTASANVVAELYKETLYGKESAEPR